MKTTLLRPGFPRCNNKVSTTGAQTWRRARWLAWRQGPPAAVQQVVKSPRMSSPLVEAWLPVMWACVKTVEEVREVLQERAEISNGQG